MVKMPSLRSFTLASATWRKRRKSRRRRRRAAVCQPAGAACDERQIEAELGVGKRRNDHVDIVATADCKRRRAACDAGQSSWVPIGSSRSWQTLEDFAEALFEHVEVSSLEHVVDTVEPRVEVLFVADASLVVVRHAEVFDQHMPRVPRGDDAVDPAFSIISMISGLRPALSSRAERQHHPAVIAKHRLGHVDGFAERRPVKAVLPSACNIVSVSWASLISSAFRRQTNRLAVFSSLLIDVLLTKAN
jgi:hypothetical protein